MSEVVDKIKSIVLEKCEQHKKLEVICRYIVQNIEKGTNKWCFSELSAHNYRKNVVSSLNSVP